MTDATFRAALWYNSEADGDREKAKQGVLKALTAFAEEEAFIIIGSVFYYELGADDERVVDPSVNMQAGTPVCLVGVADLEEDAAARYLTQDSAFTGELDPGDLEKLRAIHRKKYTLENPADVEQNGELTNEECDAGINELGPDVALAGLERYKNVLH